MADEAKVESDRPASEQVSEETAERSEKIIKGRGGKRKGSGRKPGVMSEKTLEKLAVQRALTQRMMAAMDVVVGAQLSVARGIQFLYRIDRKGKGSNVRVEHVLVTDQHEIAQALDLIETGQATDEGDGYYYITTKAPDTRAIDSIYNRVFGAIRQKIGIDGGEDGAPIRTLAMNPEQHARYVTEEAIALGIIPGSAAKAD